MKTYKTISKTLIAVVLIITVGCNNLLDLKPQTALSDATAYSTPDRIALAVTGVYDAAQSGFYAGGAVRGYPFGAAHIAQGDNRGEDVLNTQAFYQITYQSTYDGTTANNDFMWQTLFALVNRANVVLEGLTIAKPSGSLTAADIDAYKGECRFLRALAYHELLKNFCPPYSDNPTAANRGVPYRTKSITSASVANQEAVAPRGTVADDYAAIIADLDFAESVLPATRTGSLKISRATKGAAIALKTRIYQHMGNWAQVIAEGNKLIPAAASATFPSIIGGYSLPTNPYAAFSAAASKSNVESIFSLENDATDNAGANGGLANVWNTSTAPVSARALVAISPIIYNQPWFNSTDTRKSSTFITTAELPTAGGKGGYFSKKYTDVLTLSDNAPVIRYAEVLLNVAEAAGRTGALTRSFDLYNAVRSRSNAAGTDTNYDQITDPALSTPTGLIQAILNERRIEFIAEGLRWGDIHRLAQDATFNTWGGGIPVKVNGALTNFVGLYTGLQSTTDALLADPAKRYQSYPYSDKRFLWPIPNSELQVNPVLAGQQNPGW